VTRRLASITCAYTFMDYREEGQTIENMIVDIGKPPGMPLTAFNGYVALSRSRGRDTIRLLRESTTDLFTIHPDEELMDKDDRLDKFTAKTMRNRNSP
jgi:hypothetical protein